MRTDEKPAKRSRSGQGRGCVYQDKATGYWIAQLKDGDKPNGKPKYIRMKRKTEAQAVSELNAMIARKETGRLIVTSDLSLKAWLDTWLQDYVEPNVRPGTYRSYEQIVRLWIVPKLGKIALKDLQSEDIDKLIAKGRRGELSKQTETEDGTKKGKPLSADSLRLIRATLRRACNVAVKKRKLGENPVLATDPVPASSSQVAHLSTAEAAKLLAKCADSEYGNLIVVVLHTGMRIGEAIGLTWDRVDLEQGQVRMAKQLQRVGGEFALTDLKTGKRGHRTLALSKHAIDALKDQKGRAMIEAKNPPTVAQRLNLVFTTPNGDPIHARTVDKSLKELCAKAEIQPVSFHKLRHTVATCMAEAGVALEVIKDQLGHSQITLTANTYRAFVPARQQEAAQILAGLYDTEKAKQKKASE